MQNLKKFAAKGWWACLFCLFIFVIGVHSIGYDFGLPYIAEFDEARMFWNAYSMRTEQPDMIDLHGYPPAIFVLNIFVQPLTEAYSSDAAELHMWMTIAILRLMAVGANAFTTVLIAMIIRELSQQALVGLLAAICWALNPIVIYHTVLALTEAWQILFILIAVYSFCLSLKKSSAKLAILSTIAGLIAFLFKYSAFPVLGLGIFASLWNFYQNKGQLLKVLAVQLTLIGLLLAYLVFGYGLTNLSGPEAVSLSSRNYLEAFSWQDLQKILETAYTQITAPLYLIILPFIAIPLSLRKAELYQKISYLLILLGLSIHYLLMLQYLSYWEAVTRYVTPASALLIIVTAIAFSTMLSFLGEILSTRRWVYGLSLGVFLAYFGLNLLPKTIPFLQERTLPHTTSHLANWSLGIIVEGDAILQDLSIRHSHNGARVFSRSRGGWQGIWLDALGVNFEEKPIEAWQEEGFDYYLSDDWIEAENLLLLNRFPPSGEEANWQGSPHYFYRIGGIQVENNLLFGDSIHFRGYDLSTNPSNSPIRAGESIQFRAYWQADTQPDANYNLFLHIYPSDEIRLIAQADAAPVSANRLSKTWGYPDETLVGQWISITIPADTPAGNYRLVMGLYDTESTSRLSTNEGDFILITNLEIEN